MGFYYSGNKKQTQRVAIKDEFTDTMTKLGFLPPQSRLHQLPHKDQSQTMAHRRRSKVIDLSEYRLRHLR